MIQSIKLQNWKSHKSTELQFKPGVNVLVGPMGAGKSSVLQAISFALFGTFSEIKKKELKLPDLLTRGSNEKSADIELTLTASDKDFLVRRQITEGKPTEATIRSKAGAFLAGPNPTQVTTYLKNILKIDEDIFLRTVYAKQNEIDLFLQLMPLERKTRLDELMGLDRFEMARKNCIKLTNQLQYKKDTKEDMLKNFDLIILGRELDTLSTECQKLEEERAQLAQNIVAAEKDKAAAEQALKELRHIDEECNRLEERQRVITKQFKEIQQKLAGVDLSEDLNLLMTRLQELKTKINEIHEQKLKIRGDLEYNQKKILELEKSLGTFEGALTEVSKELARIEHYKTELKELEKEGTADVLKLRIKEFRDGVDKNIATRQRIIGEINVIQKHLKELEGAGSVCPICASKLESSTKEQLISERKQKVSDLQAQTTQLITEIESMKRTITNLEEVYEKQNSLLQKIEPEKNLKQKEREITIQLSETRKKREAFQSVITNLKSKVNQFDKELENLNYTYEKLVDQKHLYELNNKKAQLQQELDALETQLKRKRVPSVALQEAENKFSSSIERVQQLVSRESSLAVLYEEKAKRLFELKEKKSQVEQLQNDVKKLAKNVEFLTQFKNALIAAQQTLRTELISAVNEVMGSLWSSLYPYDTWSSVRLLVTENDYVLQLKEEAGDWIPVAGFASGGERMLACLALRLAFAKVLAPNLSLLILDEPTHNLDERAIQTLIEVIQERLSGFLDQLFIVTHDEKLAEAGQHIIRIKSD